MAMLHSLIARRGSGVRLHDGPDLKLFIFSWLGPELSSVAWSTGALAFASDFQWCCLTDQGSPSVMQHIISVESSSLLLHSYLT